MSDSVRPHRQQPTRLPRPWDSPSKNIGVGCHFLLQCIKVKSESEVTQSCPTLSDPMDCSQPGSSVHGIFQARVLEWGAIAFSAAQGYTTLNHSVHFPCWRQVPPPPSCTGAVSWPCHNLFGGSRPFSLNSLHRPSFTSPQTLVKEPGDQAADDCPQRCQHAMFRKAPAV